jgi:phage shock protein C
MTRQDNRAYRQENTRRNGWDMNLYRNTHEKMIAGVASGLADHFNVAHWVVRLLLVAGFLFTGSLAVLAYIVAWVLMAPRPLAEPEEVMEYDERRRDYRPRNMFRYSEDVTTRLQAARQRLDQSRRRVENMESYVTSRHYQLNKEFADLAAD